MERIKEKVYIRDVQGNWVTIYREDITTYIIGELEKFVEIHEEGEPFRTKIDNLDWKWCREYMYIPLDKVEKMLKGER